MQLNGLRTLLVVAAASIFMAAPIVSVAQRYNHDDFRHDRRDMKDWVDSMERESNSFRDYFEHNFKAYGHKQEVWDRSGDYSHPEHEGRNGNMTLLDAIQNMDEAFERTRGEVDRHGVTRQAREMMTEIVDHSRDVDSRIDRVADNYRFNNDRNWRYDKRSELYHRWQDLKADIHDLDRGLGLRGF